MSQIKRALVTGAAGFIGSHLCDALLDQGVEVLGVDIARDERFVMETLYYCDICSPDGLEKVIKETRPDVIFHLAVTKKQVADSDPLRTLDVNAKGTLNLLQLATEYDVKKFIYASTGSVLGLPKEHRDDAHISYPLSTYGISKMAAEAYVNLYHEVHGLNTTILRYFHIYGPRQDDSISGVVGIFCRQALHDEPLTIHGDGSQVRCFTYVDDVVEATIKAGDCDNANGATYNVVSDNRISILELASDIWILAGKDTAMITQFSEQRDPYERKVWDVDNYGIAERLGIDQWTSFDSGLQKTFEWYKGKYS